MKRRLGLGIAALGSILALVSPESALAMDHDRGGGYYSYGSNYCGDYRSMSPHERHEYEKRLRREEKEREKAMKRARKRYRDGYYNGYGDGYGGYGNGYYDQYGAWHGYR